MIRAPHLVPLRRLTSTLAWCPRAAVLVLVALLLVALRPVSSSAQTTSSLRGVMTDKDTGSPLPFGNVLIGGTKLGAVTREDGTFLIPNVPIGTYQINATYLGYIPRTIDQVHIEPGLITDLELQMKSTVATETEEIQVTGERALVEVDVTSTQRTLSQEELHNAPVTTVAEALVQQAGVTVDDNEIHIRGGRSDETQYRIDGVVVKDLISGRSGGTELAASSVSEVNVITGGFNAEFGEALSGVIDVTTREGSDQYRSYTGWSSDHFPVVGQIYKNFSRDEFSFRTEGPEPLSSKVLPGLGWKPPGKMNFFLNLSGVFTDTYLPGSSSADSITKTLASENPFRTLRSDYGSSFFGQDFTYGDEFWSPRVANEWRLFGKLSWSLGSKDKLNFSLTKNLAIDNGFDEPPIVRQDVTDATNYPWEWSRRLDHYYTYTRDTGIFSAAWNRLWSKNTTTLFRLSRSVKVNRREVYGKLWTEYQEPSSRDSVSGVGYPFCEIDRDGDGSSDSLAGGERCDVPFFSDEVEGGDASRWEDRYSRAVTGDFEMTRRLGKNHTLKTGWESSFETIQYVDIRFPWLADPQGLGGQHDIYNVHPWTGSGFVQDAFNFEGFLGNVGFRMDYWFPGEEADDAVKDTSRAGYNEVIHQNYMDDTFGFLGGRRVKLKILPRVAVSHPITDHTHLFLNYGQFAQRPSYYYVYSKIQSVSSEDFPLLGNLNLNPEIAVQYEMGLRHEFSRTFSGDATFYYKDIYDYPTSIRFSRPGQGPGFIYVNNDFARSRGFELAIKKRKNPFLSGGASYSYSVTTGKASSPNQTQFLQEVEGAFSEIGIEEGYLWWNRPHKFTVSLDYGVPERMEPERVPKLFGQRLPRDWFVNVYFLVRSGRAYTPEDVDFNETGKKYSKNAPLNSAIDLRTEKGFRLAGDRRMRVSIEGRNILNTRYPTRVDPSTGKVPTIGEGQVQEIEDTPENRGAREAQVWSYRDPSWYSPPRSVWVGVGVDW